jgi:hypothetical protein
VRSVEMLDPRGLYRLGYLRRKHPAKDLGKSSCDLRIRMET